VTRPSRLIAALGTLGVAATLVVVASSGSQATATGVVSFDPATGDHNTNITLTTSAACPQAATNAIVTVTGGDPAVASSQVSNGVIVGNTPLSAFAAMPSGGYVIPLTQTFKEFAQNTDVPFSTFQGDYAFTVTCRTSSNPASLYDFVSGLHWTPGGAFAGTYTLVPNATTTVLDASPVSPVLKGTAVTFTATVSPPVAGHVQFKDGTSNLGGAVTVAAGEAEYTTSALAAGTRSITAVFTPGDTGTNQGSVSGPLTYYVSLPAPLFLPTVSPAPRVGVASACLVSVSDATTVTYQWLKDGVVIGGAAARTYTVPETAYNHALACRMTIGNADNPPLTATSPAATAGIGPALRPTTKPYLSGTVKPGSRVYCKPGAWSPAATSYSYRWQLDGRYTSSTASSVVVPSAWHLHYVSCVVTAKRAAWTNGVAASSRVKVA
jgi:hypothetical protein